MKIKTLFRIRLFARSVMLAGLAAFAVLSFSSCTKPPIPEETVKLKVGVSEAICALVFVGQQQGMFKRHGLDVSVTNYQAGLYAVNDLMEGNVDVAVAAELVLALQGFKKGNLRALGTIASADTVEVIAKKDRGINRPEDLRGKRVGVTKNTVSDFFLHSFVSFRGIHPEEIQTINLKPSEIVTALAESKIDAASCYHPYTDAMKKNLAASVVSWHAQDGQNFYFLLIVRDELIKTRPRAVSALLKGVLEAEVFVKEHEKVSLDIVARALDVTPDAVATSWAKARFRVRLDQDILTLMEDEARWAIRNKMVVGQKVPNYLNSLYLDGLEKLKPGAVGVVH